MQDPLDEIYKAMADPHRRQIVSSLSQGPMVAGELAREVRLAPNAVSFHLKWLKSVGLVSSRREGRFLRYAANPGVLDRWHAHAGTLFRQLTPGAGESPTAATTEPAEPLPTDALPTELL